VATRIMVVEDDPLIARLLGFQLGGAGYDVVCCANGLAALMRIEQEAPDLLLLDVMMPGMSGWDLCRQVRSCSTVPIIMLTAKGADADVVAGLTAGADDYVTKPFRLPQLLARVEAVLRRAHRAQRVSAATPVQTASETTLPRRQPDLTLPPQPPAADERRLGRQLQAARLARGSSLHQAAQECGVRWEFLQALEREHFSYMPRMELRHALRTYSAYLDLDLYALTGRKPPRRLGVRLPLSPRLSLAVLTVLVLGVMLVTLLLR
jgi:DNA-binding response OmpR family regulator